MDLVTGAISSIGPKLFELLKGEYKLQKGLRKQVKFLADELDSVHGALRKVAEVPWDQLDEQVKIWACEVREASYDMEDILDTFLVRVEGHGNPEKGRLKRALKKMGGLFSKGKARHDIAGAIEDIKKQLQEVAERRAKYKVDDIVAKLAAASTIDPRVQAMYNEVERLIGINKSSDELSSMLYEEGIDSNGKTKIVSVVGVGGLGKTTLAKAVYDELNPRFDCRAFVPVGRNPDLKKVFRDILIDLDKGEYMNVKYNILDERQLINELRGFLKNKRYFIVIDDVWEVESWQKLELVLVENDRGSRVIKTTRKSEVATGDVYELQPLSDDDSKMLLYTRIFGSEGKCPANYPDEASEKILHKCGGVPLAIITVASLLAGKSAEYWFDVCNSPGFFHGKDNNKQVDDTVWILSLSYYDLPSNLKTCLLYLSVYPEDYEIAKDSLIWKWIAEGFIKKKTGTSLFQRGEEYFNQLVNRSMIQAVESQRMGIIDGCRVHDMVLDLIRDLSHELNLVTVSIDDEGTPSSSSLGRKVRRLAYQNRMMKQTMGKATERSLVSLRCDIGSWILHPSFKLLRVLALEGCRVPWTGWQGLKHLGNLLHLRYLGLRGTDGYYEVPEEIGKLKFLQTLDLDRYDQVGVLPSGVCQLTQLLCLRGGVSTKAPDGLLTKLTSLEELRISIDIKLSDESKRQFMKDLGNLSQARVLRIFGTLEGMVQSELVQSLGKLHKLQLLELTDFHSSGGTRESGEWGTLVLSRHLRELVLLSICFHVLPLWVSPAHFPCLYRLLLSVDDLDEAGLRALGGLPELRLLRLTTRRPPIAASTATVANVSTAGDGFFPKLRICSLDGWMVQLLVGNNAEDSTSTVSFTIWNGKGAMPFAFGYTTDADQHMVSSRLSAAPPVMPNLRELDFQVPVRALYKDGNGSCNNLGLEFLPSLRYVTVVVDCEGATSDDVERAKAELTHAEKLHPNKPIFEIHFRNEKKMMAQSTDQDGREGSGEEQEGRISSSAGDEVAVTPSC